MKKIVLNLKNKNTVCEVISGKNIFNELVNYVSKQKCSKYVIITDSKVKKIHGEKLLKKIKSKNIDCFMIDFPEGEKNKTRKTKAFIEDEMFKKKCGRDTIIIALGGGVVGDLAGFVAGTYMRGIPIIQIPTTTIAITDSSYGGKTGIDVPAGKNLVGLFHQPIAVFMDSELLKTLDEKNYISGLIEAIKHGIIADKKFYEFLKENSSIILSRSGKKYEKIMEQLMIKNINIKRKIVVKDQKELNLRKILNYGHTVGHAIEKLSNFNLLHGESIAIGICVESFIAYKKNICSKETYLKQKKFIESLGLNTKIPKNISTKKIIDLMSIDKKARNSMPEFTLVSKIGKYAVNNNSVAFSFKIKELNKIISEYKSLKLNL